MLVVIPDVLKPDEVAQIRKVLEGTSWVHFERLGREGRIFDEFLNGHETRFRACKWRLATCANQSPRRPR
jgi:hypothetical protein